MIGKFLALAAVFGLSLFLFSGFGGHASNAAGSLKALKHILSPVIQSQGDIPSIGLGTWLSDREKVADAVEYALTHGYDHIDAALIYRNEPEVGQGIAASGVDRSKFWVTSKLWNNDHRSKESRKAIEQTISDLGVDYLDLYLIHWPVSFMPGTDTTLDKKTSVADTWRAMEDLVRANLTRYVGISNFAPEDVETVLDMCTICPYAHEFETHPYLQQQSWVDYHISKGIKVIAYSPLGNTNPTYDSGIPALLKDPFWTAMAEKKGATVAQAVLAWGMQRGTIVIPKSVHSSYIHENLGSLDIEYSYEEMQEIADQDKKTRMNDPGEGWGVDLFRGLDDPTNLDDGEGELR